MSKNKTWFSIKAMADKMAEIFIYAEIGLWGVSAKDFAKELKALGDLDQIDLHINSPGGSVFDGLAIFNLLRQNTATVNVYVDGLAASMASVIAMVGDTVTIPENAMIMIHNPRGGGYGEAKDMKKTAEILEKAKASLISAYTAKTGMTAEEVSALMDEETWLTGEEAVASGFADTLSDAVDLAACLDSVDISKFEKVPDSLVAVMASGLANTLEPTHQTTLENSDGGAAADDLENTEDTPMTEEELQALKDQEQKDLKAQEAKRRLDIRGAFSGFEAGHSALLDSCLDDMDCSVDQARESLLTTLGSQEKPTGLNHRIGSGSDEVRSKFVAHAVDTLAVRSGLKAKPEEGNELMGHTLLEMARMSLEQNGTSTGMMNKLAMVAAAFTHGSGDFSTLLSNTANKAMLKGYEDAAETFQLWTARGSLTDFKIAERADLGTFPSLRKVAPGAEYKYVTMGERGETAQLATYGELFSITRQAIINDDMGAFTRIPRKMGRAAIRTVGDLVYAILNNNPVMADGDALFHANHGNLLTGSAPNTAAVDAMRVAMGSQKDGDAFLNIQLGYLLCGLGLEGSMKTVLESEYEVGASSKNNTTPNSVRGIADVIGDARITGNAWFGSADPNVHDAMEVLYLDGNEQPTLEQMNGWGVDGVEFKVRMDAAVKAWDSKTMAKNPGS